MAFIFSEGFDAVNTAADLENKWNTVETTGDVTWGATAGAFGGPGITTSDASGTMLGKKFPIRATQNSDDICVGFWFYVASTDTGEMRICRVYTDDEPGTEDIIIELAIPSGTLDLQIQRAGSSVLATASSAITAATWHWIEFRCVVGDGSAGEWEMYVDATQVLNWTGDNRNSGSFQTNVGEVRFYGNASPTYSFDDIIIWDLTGSTFNSFPLGETRIQTLFADGDGDVSNSTASAGTRWQAVDEQDGNDGDTTYVDLANTGDYDLYTFDDITELSPDHIDAVVVNTWAQADANSPMELRHKVKTGTTEGNGDTLYVPPEATAYWGQQHCFTTDPDTATAWTESGVNGMQAGQEVVGT